MSSHKVKMFLLLIFRFYRCCERTLRRMQFVDLKQIHDKNNYQQYSKSGHLHANNKGIDLLCQDFRFPDITGEFTACDQGGREYPTGAFYDAVNHGMTIGSGSAGYDIRFGMKASKTSNIYGKSTVVQQSAFQALTIIKI